MSQPNKDQGNRAKARRARREAARVPGKGAGQPVPIRQSPSGQPAANSLADLAKSGGQVPLSIPQLMAQVGTLKVERDFWMNAAVNIEAQVNELTGGVTTPSVEEVVDAEEEQEEEIQDIPTTVEACPGCSVALGPDAVHAEDCQFQEHEFTGEGEAVADEEATPVEANVPDETLPTQLTREEQQVVDEANESLAQQAAADEGRQSPLQEETPE